MLVIFCVQVSATTEVIKQLEHCQSIPVPSGCVPVAVVAAVATAVVAAGRVAEPLGTMA